MSNSSVESKVHLLRALSSKIVLLLVQPTKSKLLAGKLKMGGGVISTILVKEIYLQKSKVCVCILLEGLIGLKNTLLRILILFCRF